MNEIDAASLQRVLSAIFSRRGGNGRYARLFEDLADNEKTSLLAVVNMEVDELPVIGSFEGANSWFLLSTTRIVWCIGDEKKEVSIGDVRDALVDFEALRSRGLTKLEARHIQIVTSNGRFTIEIEQGAPFSGIWNVLRHLGIRNKKTPEER